MGFGSDSETERRSEWATYIGGWVDEGDTVVELRASGSGEDQVAECDLDTGDLRIRENPLAVYSGRILGVLAGESPGHHAHPKEKGTGFVSNLSEADRVNARPLEANGIEVLVDLSALFPPHRCDWVDAAVPWAGSVQF